MISMVAWITLAISVAIHLLTLGYLFGVLRTKVERHDARLNQLNGIDKRVDAAEREIEKLRARMHERANDALVAIHALTEKVGEFLARSQR